MIDRSIGRAKRATGNRWKASIKKSQSAITIAETAQCCRPQGHSQNHGVGSVSTAIVTMMSSKTTSSAIAMSTQIARLIEQEAGVALRDACLAFAAAAPLTETRTVVEARGSASRMTLLLLSRTRLATTGVVVPPAVATPLHHRVAARARPRFV